MELTKDEQQVQSKLNSIYMKCWEDENFKNELLASPVKALESHFGYALNISEDTILKVTDQSAHNTIHINIPQKPDLSNTELTDNELEMVAGGCALGEWFQEKYASLKTLLDNVDKSAAIDVNVEL